MEGHMVSCFEHGAQCVEKVFCITVVLCSLDIHILLTKFVVVVVVVVWCWCSSRLSSIRESRGRFRRVTIGSAATR